MNKYNYFEYEGDIPPWYSVLDTLRELTSEFRSLKPESPKPEAEEIEPPAITQTEAEEPPLEPPAFMERTLPETVISEPQPEVLEHTPEELNRAIAAFEGTAVPERAPAAAAAAAGTAGSAVHGLEELQHQKKQRKERMTLFERLFVKRASPLKHFFISVLMLVFIAAIFSGVVYVVIQSINEKNSKISDFNSSAATVCSNLSRQYGYANYENMYNTYHVEGYRLTGLCFVRELDFDEDGVSELMVTYNKNGVYINEVWGTNDSGSFGCLFTAAAAQTENRSDDAYSVLYRTGNKYYIATFGEDLAQMKLHQLKNGKFEERFSAQYQQDTQSYTVDGKDATSETERIRYAVLNDSKASAMADEAMNTMDGFTVGGVEADRPAVEQNINTAYYGVVQEYNKRYGVAAVETDKSGRAYVGGLAVVRLVDFDGDEKDELMLVYRKPVKVRQESDGGEPVLIEEHRYFCDIYRYSGNKAVLVYSNEGLSNKVNSQSDIYFVLRYEDGLVYYCSNSFTSEDYGNYIYAVSTRLKYNGTEFKPDFKAVYETEYGSTRYYLEGMSVSMKAFEEKGYQVPFFDGTDVYDENVNRVTYVQRRSILKKELADIPAQTEKEIQKLNQLYTSDMVQN